MFWNKQQMDILLNIEKHERKGTPCIIAGAWGTGKTLLLAYKAFKLSSEGRKVVFISSLDSEIDKVTQKHYVFEEKIRMDFESNKNIKFYTMKDIVKYIEEQYTGNQRSDPGLLQCVTTTTDQCDQCEVQDHHNDCMLIHFVKERVRTGTYHILIDELEVDKNLSIGIYQLLQAIKIDSGSLTVAMSGDTEPYTLRYTQLDNEPTIETIVLKKIMRMCQEIYNEVTTNPEHAIFPWIKDILVKQSTVQHTVLGCKPEYIKVSSKDEVFSIGLKEALSKVASHPVVVVLFWIDYPNYENVLNVFRVEEVIRANSDKPVIAFTGERSELDDLRDFLRNPSGFLVTSPDLYNGMEAMSVINIYSDKIYNLGIPGMCRATTSLLNIVYEEDFIFRISKQRAPNY